MAKSKRHHSRGNATVGSAAVKRPEPRWHGQEARPGSGGSESPEDAAKRAEGNAPLAAAEAARRAANVDDAAPGPRGPHRHPEAGADDVENAEEKRRAVAEEHAAEPWGGAPHGKL